LSILWFIGALILNDLLICYTVYLWYEKMKNKSFGLHVIMCTGCENPQIVPKSVGEVVDCELCHVCENCGKIMACENCGKKQLVRQEVSGISFCDAIGCFESWKIKENKLKKKELKLAKKK